MKVTTLEQAVTSLLKQQERAGLIAPGKPGPDGVVVWKRRDIYHAIDLVMASAVDAAPIQPGAGVSR